MTLVAGYIKYVAASTGIKSSIYDFNILPARASVFQNTFLSSEELVIESIYIRALSNRYPLFAVAPEILRRGSDKISRIRLPDMPLDTYRCAVYIYAVKGIGFAAMTGRDGAAGLYDQRRMVWCFVTLGGVPGVGHVHMTGKEQVGAAPGQRLDSQRRTSDNITALMALGQVKWMMRDDDLGNRIILIAQVLAGPGDLFLINPAAFYRQRTRGVDTQNRNLIVKISWPQVVGNVAPVLRQRIDKPAKNIVKRHVVIAGDNDRRLRQAVEKRFRGAKLDGARTLCQVARNGDQIRADLIYRAQQRVNQPMIDHIKMNI